MSANESNANKFKALETLFHSVEKQFGKGTIMRLSDDAKIAQELQVIPSGSVSLDVALGVGGLPKGRIIEIYGTESSGKTTLTLHAIAECQKKGGIAAFIDAEHALDVSYARKIGVNTSDLLVSQPDHGEQALEIVDMLVRSGAVDLIVVDSVAALTPRAEIEGEMGDSHMGLQARLMSQALRKLTGSISKTNCIVIFINQVRMKIGVMFGNPETTTGGQALKFYSSVRLEVRRAAAIKNGNDTTGHRTKVKVVKNKVAAPFKEVEFDIMFGQGISKEGDLLDLASSPEAEIVQKSGTWFTYNGERLGQGRENAKEYLREHPETLAKIENAVRSRANLIKTASSAESDAEDSTVKSLPGAAQALPASSSPQQTAKPGRKGAAASVEQ
ncbi:recombinase RecA [Pigmentibacter sp. JX0631]|uniref:recombinase RecA n=1 Tax=Pigmentibacter sp. JX0631 TaxID=2976982 RepID=UPI002468F7EA|nr:recombinase RecA [Pigmentibacter sp. JX0631]WGL59870.1 recombinase RecA [Pigmentibacter sp. JX0631]